MYKFNHILVALDHSDLDIELIQAASFFAKISETKKICFIHVVRDVSIPDSVKKEFPDMVKNALKDRKKEFEALVHQHFTFKKAKVNIIVSSGQPTKEIMKTAEKNEVDVILMGRKSEKKSTGVLINRLTRRASCSLLIIPRGYKKRVDKILVPIDFSDYSSGAMKQAVDLAEKNLPDVKIFVQNVFRVPMGYHYTGKSFQEFARIMKENAEKDYLNFMKDIDTKGIHVEPMYTLDKEDNTIDAIYNTAKKLDVDAIVVGAKGRTTASALFIGSSAERLVQKQEDIPLMVVRPKDEQAGFIDFIKEI